MNVDLLAEAKKAWDQLMAQLSQLLFVRFLYISVCFVRKLACKNTDRILVQFKA